METEAMGFRCQAVGLGAGPEAHAGGLAIGDEQDDSHSYLFGRGGGRFPWTSGFYPAAVIVGSCSGCVLLFSFFLMFSRVRFGVIWVVTAVLCLLAAIFAHPSASCFFFNQRLQASCWLCLGF